MSTLNALFLVAKLVYIHVIHTYKRKYGRIVNISGACQDSLLKFVVKILFSKRQSVYNLPDSFVCCHSTKDINVYFIKKMFCESNNLFILLKSLQCLHVYFASLPLDKILIVLVFFLKS